MKRIIPPFLLAALLVSCGYVGSGNANGSGNGSPNGSASPNPPDVETPAGAWVLTRGTTASGDIFLPPGHPITLTIDAEKVGGHAACNIYGGTVAMDGDAIHLSAMSMTEMACLDDEAMNAEAAYMTALGAVTRWARADDQLILSGGGVELTFGLQPPVPDAEIVGTSWVLDTLIQGDAASTVLGEATLVLAADGTFIGSTGCRELTGTYAISGDAIDFSDVTPTGDCTDELRGQDGLVLDVLDGSVKATVDGSTLLLIGTDQQGLGYHHRGRHRIGEGAGQSPPGNVEAARLAGVGWCQLILEPVQVDRPTAVFACRRGCFGYGSIGVASRVKPPMTA